MRARSRNQIGLSHCWPVSKVRRDGLTHASLEVAGQHSTFSSLTPLLTSGSPHFLMPLFYPVIKSLWPNDTARGVGDNGEDVNSYRQAKMPQEALTKMSCKENSCKGTGDSDIALVFKPERQKCVFRQTWWVCELERIEESDSSGHGANLSVVKSTNRGPRESLRVLLKDPALKIPLKLNPERKDTLTGDDFCEFIKKHHNLLFSVFIGPQRHRGWPGEGEAKVEILLVKWAPGVNNPTISIRP